MTPLLKGDRIRARWLAIQPIGTFSLTGMQMKAPVQDVEVVGIVRHLRGDGPVPTKILLYVEAESEVPDWLLRERPFGCECPEHDRLVVVNPERVVEVIRD